MSGATFLQTAGLILNTFELESRVTLFPNWIFFALVFSMALVSSVRYVTMDYFLYMWQGISKNTLLQIEFRTGSAPVRRGTVLLTANYILTGTLFIYMLATYLNAPTGLNVLVIPTLLFFYHQFTLLLTGALTGEYKRLRELFKINTIIYQWFGLLVMPLLLIWLLHPNHSTSLLFAIAVLFGLLTLIRFFKGFVKAIENKLPWYYIFLYFCTAEIWPVIFILKLQ